MSVLNEVTTKAKSVVGEKVPGASGLLGYLTEYLHRADTGGLPGLVQKFEKAGLGAQIQSWIGMGPKLPISPVEVTRVLGSTEIAAMATKIGVAPDVASQRLANILPEVVNHLTPEGAIPSAGKIGELVGSLKEMFDR